MTLAELATAGARRISLGAALSRTALGALFRALDDLRAGRFDFLATAAPTAQVNACMVEPNSWP